MTDKIRDGIFVGDITDARDDGSTMDAVVTLCNDRVPSTTHYKYIVDGQNEQADFNEAVETAKRALADNDTVLVHCSSGQSRSVGVVGAILAERDGVSFEAALDEVKEKRDKASPTFFIRQQARAYLGEPVKTLDDLFEE